MSRPPGPPTSDLRTDEQLVDAFVAGDEGAYAELVRRYERRVFGICMRYFGDAAEAEDAAQNALVTLYRRASTFRGGAKFSTWMYRVTTNACNDIARRRARRPQKADAVVEDLPIADLRDDIGATDLRLDLREALAQLDGPHRRAVIAHTVEGVPYHDIAEAEGVAVGTIKSRVHRGHAKLAVILEEMGAGHTVPSPPPTGRPGAGPDPQHHAVQRLDRGPPHTG